MQHRLADPRATTDAAGRRGSRASTRRSCSSAPACTATRPAARRPSTSWCGTWPPSDRRRSTTCCAISIVLVVPSQNPDGLQMMAEWQAAQRRHAVTRTRRCPSCITPTPATTTTATASCRRRWRRSHLSRLLYRDWLPEVYLDLHQMGPIARTGLRAAVSQSGQPEHRPAGLEPGQPARPDDGDAAAGRGQDRRAVGRDLQRLLAGRQQHDAVVAQHRRHAERSGQRADVQRDRAGERRARRRGASRTATDRRHGSRRSWRRPPTCSSA